MKVTNIHSITKNYIQNRLDANKELPAPSDFAGYSIKRNNMREIKFEAMRQLQALGYSDKDVHLIMSKKIGPKIEKIEKEFGLDVTSIFRTLELGPKKSDKVLKEQYYLASLFWDTSTNK